MKNRKQKSIEKDIRRLSPYDRQAVTAIAYQLHTADTDEAKCAFKRLLADIARGDGSSVRMAGVSTELYPTGRPTVASLLPPNVQSVEDGL